MMTYVDEWRPKKKSLENQPYKVDKEEKALAETKKG